MESQTTEPRYVLSKNSKDQHLFLTDNQRSQQNYSSNKSYNFEENFAGIRTVSSKFSEEELKKKLSKPQIFQFQKKNTFYLILSFFQNFETKSPKIL